MIDIKNLRKTFGNNNVLKDISMHVNQGEIFGLVGTSGAGKSTLLRCINGLVEYDSGSLIVNDLEIKDQTQDLIRETRKQMGMIFQDFALIQRKTVFENISMPMQCWGYGKSTIENRVNELLDLVNLSDKKSSYPNELSGGQQQRVAIARAISMNPKILLCDEATSSLDPNTSRSILDLINQINKELNITVIIVAHQMSVVKQICDKIAIMEDGIIKSQGRTRKIFFEYPDSLKRLLGVNYDEILPKRGYNLKIEFETSENEILSEISKATNVDYSYIWGGFDKFKNDTVGTAILNVSDSESKNIVERYLNEKNVTYEWMDD